MIRAYMDGVLETAKTTNLPTASLEPAVRTVNLSGTGVRTTRVRYLECYNI